MQLRDFRDEQDAFEKLIDALIFDRGNRAANDVAAPIFRHETLFLKLAFHLVHIRSGRVHFGNGDDDVNLRGLRVIHRLDGLRHDAVIGGDDEHDDVRDRRPARPHRGECGVAGGVEEGDALVFARNGIRADVLRDAARLARRDARFADRIHQRRLAVIDVAHERDDRRAQFEFVFFLRDFRLLGLLGFLDDGVELLGLVPFFFFKNEAVLGADFPRHVRLDRLVDRRENVQLHQIADELERLHIQRRREIADDDRRLDVDDFFVAFSLAIAGGIFARRWGGGLCRRFGGRRDRRRSGLGADEFGNARERGERTVLQCARSLADLLRFVVDEGKRFLYDGRRDWRGGCLRFLGGLVSSRFGGSRFRRGNRLRSGGRFARGWLPGGGFGCRLGGH